MNTLVHQAPRKISNFHLTPSEDIQEEKDSSDDSNSKSNFSFRASKLRLKIQFSKI